MKKIAPLVLVVLLLSSVGCSKQKTCRCSVLGESRVRIIEIEKGECEYLHVYNYHSALDSLEVDSLICTDYEFDIDSIFNE